MTEGVKRLYRSHEERMIAGVCGGLAEYTNLDPTIVRLLFVGVSILGAAPGMMLAYLAMMVVGTNYRSVVGIRIGIIRKHDALKRLARWRMLTSKALRFEGRVIDLSLMCLYPLQMLQNASVIISLLKKPGASR